MKGPEHARPIFEGIMKDTKGLRDRQHALMLARHDLMWDEECCVVWLAPFFFAFSSCFSLFFSLWILLSPHSCSSKVSRSSTRVRRSLSKIITSSFLFCARAYVIINYPSFLQLRHWHSFERVACVRVASGRPHPGRILRISGRGALKKIRNVE